MSMSMSMSMSVSAALPPELMAEILRRLPVKTLLQVRCVSKLWRRFIDSSYFIQTHLNHHSTQNQLFLLLSGLSNEIVKPIDEYLPDTAAVRVDLENPLQCSRTSLRRRGRAMKIKYRFPSLPDHLQIIVLCWSRFRWQGTVHVWGACNGLVLISNFCSTCLWNPSTRKHFYLPKLDLPSHERRVDLYGFGYDSASCDYKVIMMTLLNRNQELDHQVWVYSLRSNLWRQVIISFPLNMKCERQPGVLVQEALHWPVKVSDDDLILAFDFNTEDYRMYSQPRCRNAGFHSRLGSMNGLLCLIYSYLPLGFETWVMREECWTRVTLEPGDFISYPGGFIAATLRDGKKIMLHNGGMCSKVDTREGSFRKVICSTSDVCIVSLISPDAGHGKCSAE